MDDADDLRRQLEEEDRKADALKDKMADEQLSKIAGLQVQKLDLNDDQQAYTTAILKKITSAPLSTAEMCNVAKTLDVEMTETEAAKIFSSFDMDKDGVLNNYEFALWWLQCYRPVSVLLRAAITMKHERLQSAPAKPEWTPGVKINYNFTTGLVDESYAPKSAVYFSSLPASKALLEAAVEQHAASVKGPDDEGLPKKNINAVLAAYAPIRADAKPDDVAECVELFKAVMEEYSAVDESPVAATMAQVTENGKPYLKLVVMAKGGPKASRAVPQVKEYERFVQSSAAQRGMFEKVLLGVEFGTDAKSVFSAGSTKALLSLADNMRGSVVLRATDAAADNMEAAALSKVKDRNLARDYVFTKLIPPTLFGRGLRQLNGTTAFDNPKELLDLALEELVQSPLRRAVEAGASRDEIIAVKGECDVLRSRVKSVLNQFMPWEITASELLGFKKLDELLGEAPDCVRIAVVGPPGSGKTWLTHCLQFPDAATASAPSKPDDQPPSVAHSMVHKGKPVLLFDVRSDALGTVAGMKPHYVVVCIDCSAANPNADLERFAKVLKQSGADRQIAASDPIIVLTNGDKNPSFKLENVPEGAKVFNSALCCDAPKLPMDMLSSLVEGAELGEAPSTGEEIAQTLALGFRKVSTGIESAFATSEIADVALQLENMPLFEFFPESMEGLNILRAKSRAQLRGARQSAKSMGQAEFRHCGSAGEYGGSDDDEDPRMCKKEYDSEDDY